MRKHSALKLSFSLVAVVAVLAAMLALNVFAADTEVGDADGLKQALAAANSSEVTAITLTNSMTVTAADVAVPSGAKVVLKGDSSITLSVNGEWVIPGANAEFAVEGITVDFNPSGTKAADGYNKTDVGRFVVNGAGSVFTLKNATIANGYFYGSSGNGTLGAGVAVTAAANVVMENSNIVNCYNRSNSGGAISLAAGSSLKMTGGSITGGWAYAGGAIYAAGASVELEGAELSGSISRSYGGAVAFSGAYSFKMTNTKVIGNTAATYAGAISLPSSGTVNGITGGEISNNTATTAAGALYISTNVDLIGVKMENNTANGSYSSSDKVGGGALCVYGYTTNIGEGTVIRGNHALVNGGGVGVISGTVNVLEGASVENNDAPDGGGVYMKAGTLNVKGGKINGNRATGTATGSTTGNGGGGICTVAAAVNVTGGEINGNVAEVNGGGILLFGDGSAGRTFTMTGGSISDNEAKAGSGGGIYQLRYDKLNISNAAISGNKTGGNGGAIVSPYRTAGVTTITDTAMNGNTAVSGGALYWTYGTLNISGGEAKNNEATGGNGGAIRVQGSKESSISGILVSGNKANEGGGIFIGGSHITTITDVKLFGNTAHTSGAGFEFGSGASASHTTAAITGTVIAGNYSGGNGGGIWAGSNSEITMTDCTIGGSAATGEADAEGTTGNYAAGSGSAAMFLGDVILDNVAVKGNVTAVTGGIYSSGTATVKNVVLNGNEAANKAPGIYVPAGASVSVEGNITADGEAFFLESEGVLKKNGELAWSDTIAIAVSARSEDGKEILVAGGAEVTEADAQKFELITVIEFNEAAIGYDEESGAVVLKLTELETAAFTVISANNGEEKEVKVVVVDGSITLPEQSTLVSDLAGEGYGIENFVGYAAVENFGETSAALTALYPEGASLAKADIDGKTVYAVWVKVETVGKAAIKINETSETSGLRFVSFLETEVLARIGIKNVSSSEMDEGAVGYNLGINITRDADAAGEETKTFCDTVGGKLFTDVWYGDELYAGCEGLPELGGSHAFSFGLILDEDEFGYEFTPEAFITVMYSDSSNKTVSGGIPQADGSKFKTSVNAVALSFEGFLVSTANAKANEPCLGLTEEQVNVIAGLAGNTWDASSKSFK